MLASVVATQVSKSDLMPFAFYFDYSNSVAFDSEFAESAVRFLLQTKVVLANLAAGSDFEKS